MKYLFLFLILVGMIFLGCTIDTVKGKDVCVPNTTQECMCSGGISGSQTCSEDGSEWEKCTCLDISDDPDDEIINDSSDENLDQQEEETDSEEEESVEPACTDLDGDNYSGHGDGCDPGAVDYDCDEDRADVYRGAEELCDNADNDCDGELDENYNFLIDLANCGACGVACLPSEECIEGFCSCGFGFCGSDERCIDEKCCIHDKCSTPMVTIPEGPFMMGCNASIDEDCNPYEFPYHRVSVPEFRIDTTEVTVEQYLACVADNLSCIELSSGMDQCNWRFSGRDDHPINCITWTSAKEYCEWAGKRLCTESEWEKAARGTDSRIYPWGNEEATCERTIMSENGDGCGEVQTWSVASKSLGVYGLYDMSGNVWEWVEDDWHDHYNEAPEDGSAWIETPRLEFRVLRGGGFDSSPRGLRSSSRKDGVPGHIYSYFGMRCCM